MESSTIELFILKCATLKLAVESALPSAPVLRTSVLEEKVIASLISQFSGVTRDNAVHMAAHYKLFYMLENEIRSLIRDTLVEHHKGDDWWEALAPETAKSECKANLLREREAGFTPRSDDPLDYVTFGQLGDIIRANYPLFGGILSSPKAMGRVMFALNNLRGPIAHCGVLADDEVDRLKTSVKDWFRLLEGPK